MRRPVSLMRRATATQSARTAVAVASSSSMPSASSVTSSISTARSIPPAATVAAHVVIGCRPCHVARRPRSRSPRSRSLLLAPGGGGRRASAKVTLQATGTASVGYTDNATSATDEQPRDSDAIFQLVPGAVLSQEAPRLQQRLAYAFTADLFARHFEASSYSNRLDWLGSILTSTTTKLTLSLQTLQGRISTFNVNQASSDTTVGVLPANTQTDFFSQTASEAFEATPTAGWRVTQDLLFNAFVPIDRGRQPDTYSTTVGIGGERFFRDDAVGLVLRCAFVDYQQPRDPMTDVAIGFDDRQLLTSLVARWRRDWSRSWNTEAQLGAISIVGVSAEPATPVETAWEPSALAAVRWVQDIGSAELHYAHTVAPNTLTGNTLATDEAALIAGVPLFAAKVLIGATVAYQHVHQLALAPGVTEATANLVVVDATIGWLPRPEVRVFARYSLFDQFGSPPVGGVPAVLPDLTRNVVMVGVNVTYPAVAALRAPLRGASRVDETDQPAFVAPHAPEPR